MPRLFLAIAAITSLMACTAAARPEVATPTTYVAPAAASAPVIAAAARVSCDVRATPTAHGVRLQGVVSSSGRASGDYEMVITKAGAGGSSDVTQAGPFTTNGGATVLDSAEVSLERGAHYRAVLTLRDAHGEICRQERRA